jgi:hypothetical protein
MAISEYPEKSKYSCKEYPTAPIHAMENDKFPTEENAASAT